MFNTPKVAVLIPCFNEEAPIAQSVAGFATALSGAEIYVYGGGEFTRFERAAISKGQAESRVKHLGGSDADLANCHVHASLYVYPSHYEGFGITLLEAMSLDCPVGRSNSRALPEVAGDAAKMFDTRNTESIRFALESVLNSTSETAALIQRGRRRNQLYIME